MRDSSKTALMVFLMGMTLAIDAVQAQIAYRVTEKDIIPEGITYSRATNSFYISSLHKNKIIQIDAETGKFRDFISSSLLPMQFLGMIVDGDGKHLWACGNISKDGKHHSTVAKFDLETGKLVNQFLHIDAMENTYNDLVQDKDGNVYFTNTASQTVYVIGRDAEKAEVFFDGPGILHPNGITISPDGRYLYVASNDNGIMILDMKKKRLASKPDDRFDSKGLDGLKYYKNSLIGLQNEVKSRRDVKLARYFLNETGTEIVSMKIMDQNNPNFDIPTTFVMDGGNLYLLANSQMANIDFSTNKIRSYDALDDVLILKYKLE